jgi:hypothetical protein
MAMAHESKRPLWAIGFMDLMKSSNGRKGALLFNRRIFAA